MVFRKERLRRACAGVTVAGSDVERFLTVERPYRLDLTVDVLRRFSTNVVDVMGPDGAYVRLLGDRGTPMIVRVQQAAPHLLRVHLTCDAAEEPRALALVGRVLGTGRRTPGFDRAAAQLPWLRDLAQRMRGVRAPRYPSLWEACVNAIVFQQLSLHAASAILRRTIVALCEPVRSDGIELRRFPDAATLTRADDETLRAAGLSSAKIATLRRVADAVANGELEEDVLEARSSASAVARLCEMKGIGAWTATVILLRGLGRLDVFPANDSGVARSLTALAGAPVDIAATLQTLGSERGMLYYHLLLARLEASGQLLHHHRVSDEAFWPIAYRD